MLKVHHPDFKLVVIVVKILLKDQNYEHVK